MRNAPNLDNKNRFFKDNKKLYSTYKHKAPQLYVYKDPSPRVEEAPVQEMPASSSQHD
jgi:hypothetical protein